MTSERELVTPSAEARYPMIAALADGPAGTLPRATGALNYPARCQRDAFGPKPGRRRHPATPVGTIRTLGPLTVTLPNLMRPTTVTKRTSAANSRASLSPCATDGSLSNSVRSQPATVVWRQAVISTSAYCRRAR